MLREIKVWWLKRQARNTYLEYARTADSYECGLSMADMVSGGRVSSLKKKFNWLLDQLQELGEPVPSKRL